MTFDETQPPTYSWHDLEEYVHWRWPHVAMHSHGQEQRFGTTIGLPEFCGFVTNAERQRYFRLRRRPLSTIEADRIAIAIGVHPSHIWSDYFADAGLEPRCADCEEWIRLDAASTQAVYCPECSARRRRTKKRLVAREVRGSKLAVGF